MSIAIFVLCVVTVVPTGAQAVTAMAEPASFAPSSTVTFSQDADYACSTVQQTQVNSAVTDAIAYAQEADTYFESGYRGARYVTWFGAYESTRWNLVATRVEAIRAALVGQNLLFKCPQAPANADCGQSVFAYVYPTAPYEYYLCSTFFSSAATGTDSRAGSLIHLTSQFNAVVGAQSYASGQSAAQALALSNPANAALNADNFEYFAENTPTISVAVSSVAVSPTTTSMYVGESTSITASISPTNAENQNVAWSSSDTSVATVSSSGLVTAVASGSVAITATTSDGSHTSSSAVTVSAAPASTGPSSSQSSESVPTPRPSVTATAAVAPTSAEVQAPVSSASASSPTGSSTSAWTRARIRALRPAQIRALTARDLAALTPSMFTWFTSAQMRYIRPGVTRSLSPSHIRALSSPQARALGLLPRASWLSSDQRRALAFALHSRSQVS